MRNAVVGRANLLVNVEYLSTVMIAQVTIGPIVFVTTFRIVASFQVAGFKTTIDDGWGIG